MAPPMDPEGTANAGSSSGSMVAEKSGTLDILGNDKGAAFCRIVSCPKSVGSLEDSSNVIVT